MNKVVVTLSPMPAFAQQQGPTLVTVSNGVETREYEGKDIDVDAGSDNWVSIDGIDQPYQPYSSSERLRRVVFPRHRVLKIEFVEDPPPEIMAERPTK